MSAARLSHTALRHAAPLMTALLMAGAVHADVQADIITQWNFNSNPADTSTGTGSTLPSVGAGVADALGVNTLFASGSSNGGSSDPATTDNSGWQTTGYAAQGTGDKSTGVQFAVSTVGFDSVFVSYDLRHSNTSARHEMFQYSLDGLSFVDFMGFDGNAGDTWFNRTVDLSGIAGVADNDSFAFRIVSTFAPGTQAYAASRSSSNYAAGGTWRFDMVTVSGMAITPAVPEPETYALLAAGLLIVWVMSSRRLG